MFFCESCNPLGLGWIGLKAAQFWFTSPGQCSRIEGREKEIAIILKRKILTAILSSFLFALAFSNIGGFEEDRFVNLFLNLFYLNLMLAITYGVIASVFSDWLSRVIANKALAREIASFIIHCCCGAVLQVFGLGSAVLFFIIDRLLSRMKIGWLSVIIAILIVVLVFFIMI
ncbi:hypothetical protein [Cytobacillus sp. FSL R5-0596]|uniref:hypothetical protein n=1 Tax=Cytobacillus sp. FSL R5-0596 TaxID=2954696 RepID=UPI0030F610B9